jgi:hypothetical protein
MRQIALAFMLAGLLLGCVNQADAGIIISAPGLNLSPIPSPGDQLQDNLILNPTSNTYSLPAGVPTTNGRFRRQFLGLPKRGHPVHVL